METKQNIPQNWRFGVFEVDVRRFELRRSGVVVKLREQPFRILVYLLEHPGEIVSREDLRRMLWPADTFVDFDQGMNAAIKKLRDALGDVADEPIYIETIPKRGYRFIAPVTEERNGVIKPASPAQSPWGNEANAPREPYVSEEAGPRTDIIYALGLALSEAATGERSAPHEGVLQTPYDALNRGVETDPKLPQSNAEPRLDPQSGAREPAGASSRGRSTLLALALAVVTLLLAALAFVHFREQAPPPQAVRMSILLPEKSLPQSLAVSPDGREIALVLVKDGKQQIWVRAIDALDQMALAGTDGAADPFWSPDSRSIAFFADAKLKKVDRDGGTVQTICDALGIVGGTWNWNGEILLGGLSKIQKVSADGGAVSDLPGSSTVRETYPSFLPDGRHYLTTRTAADATQGGVWLNSMDGSGARHLLPDISKAELVAPPSGSRIGDVLFARGGTLMALPFDMKALQAAGDAFPVADKIADGADPSWSVATSNREVLAYISGNSSDASSLTVALNWRVH